MKSNAIGYLLLTGPKRLRRTLADGLRGMAVWRVLRPVYRACAPMWANPVTAGLTGALRRRLYRMIHAITGSVKAARSTSTTKPSCWDRAR